MKLKIKAERSSHNIIAKDINTPFAAKRSRDLLFIKLWAATLRMPEMEKARRKHQMAKFEAPGIKE